MNCKKYWLILCLALILISTNLFTVSEVFAQSDNLVLEDEQHWETYQVGGTCISGSHNLFVGNIDQDEDVEIITGGSSYKLLANGSTTSREAPLRIWNWNGKNITLEMQENWPGSINCVYCSDVDGDGKTELFTSGSVWNETGVYSSFRAWRYNGSSLNQVASVEGVPTTAVFVKDVNQDGTQEIITIGRFNVTEKYGAKLNLWHLEKNILELVERTEWCTTNVTSVNSVFAADLNNDGANEIVTAGYAYDLRNSSGQLRVWQYKGNVLTLKANEEWRLKEDVYALNTAGGIQGNTIVNSLKVGDVDADGIPEIVTGGFTFDGENICAQLRIWSWDGGVLSLENSKEWVTDYLTEIKSISLNDVDGDSKLEIITSGVLGAKGSFAKTVSTPERSQLRVWNWDGVRLNLEQGKDWTIDEGACAWNVATGDVDKDGVVEIVNVGCTYFSNLCDPDMRIWSTKVVSSSFPTNAIAFALIMLATGLTTALLMKKRRKKTALINTNCVLRGSC